MAGILIGRERRKEAGKATENRKSTKKDGGVEKAAHSNYHRLHRTHIAASLHEITLTSLCPYAEDPRIYGAQKQIKTLSRLDAFDLNTSSISQSPIGPSRLNSGRPTSIKSLS